MDIVEFSEKHRFMIPYQFRQPDDSDGRAARANGQRAPD